MRKTAQRKLKTAFKVMTGKEPTRTEWARLKRTYRKIRSNPELANNVQVSQVLSEIKNRD